MNVRNNCILFSFLIVVAGLNGVQGYSRNDPDMYIHVAMLKNKYGPDQITSLLAEAKRIGETASDLLEIKKLDCDIAIKKDKELSRFFMGVFWCLGGISFCAVIGSSFKYVPDWIKAWKGGK
jgi:hypothetical protein